MQKEAMSDVRHRGVRSSSKTPFEHTAHTTVDNDEKNDGKGSRIDILDILRVVILLIFASCALSYYVTSNSVLWGYRPWFTRLPVVMRYIVRYPLVSHPLSLVFST
jgi:hypothetical protein